MKTLTRGYAMRWIVVGWCSLLPLTTIAADAVIRIPALGVGPIWSHIPFSGLTLTDVAPMRMQQVYSSSVFLALGEQAGWISALWFVSDSEVGRIWSAPLPRVEINMSTTQKEPDKLNVAFTENLGASVTTVYSSGPLVLTSGGRGSVVKLILQKPFYYHPTNGNLLLEIKNFEPTCCPGNPSANAGPLDAWDDVGDSISRVYARGDANASTGIADSLGLTTYFVVEAVPTLAVAIQSTNLVIQWPRAPITFTLQRSSLLGSNSSWQQAGGIVTTNGADLVVTLPIDSSARFFRLISQDSSSGPPEFHLHITFPDALNPTP